MQSVKNKLHQIIESMPDDDPETEGRGFDSKNKPSITHI